MSISDEIKIIPAVAGEVIAGTPAFYRAAVEQLYKVFERENALLFDGRLPYPVLRFDETMPAMGLFCHEKSGDAWQAVIKIYYGLADKSEFAEAVLLHEMIHLAQSTEHPILDWPTTMYGTGEHAGCFRKAANMIGYLRRFKRTHGDAGNWPMLHKGRRFAAAWSGTCAVITGKWRQAQLEHRQAVERERERIAARLMQRLSDDKLSAAFFSNYQQLTAGHERSMADSSVSV